MTTSASTDLEHLRLLSIFHYVVGGIAALLSLFPVIHLVMGVAMVTGRMDGSEEPGARVVGVFFILFALTFIVCGIGYAVCVILAGRFLARQAHYIFCFVMAAVSCAFVPFGTVLGVFTIIVLSRPSVKALFTRPAAPPAL